jgi:hypothetical protein
MKPTSYLSVLIVVLITALLYPSSATAYSAMAGTRTTFTGTSNFSETINAGVWTYLPSGNVLARGIVERYHDYNSDPRLSGVETIVSNANFRPAPSSELGLAGNLWGTFHIENAGLYQ